MDGVGAAAAILQLAEMASKTAVEVYEFCAAIRDAPREISAISNDVNAVRILIRNLEGSLSSGAVQGVVNEDDEVSDALWTLETPLRNCHTSLGHVKEKMSPYLKTDVGPAQSPEDSTRTTQPQRSSRFSRTYVLWYFKRKEIFTLVAELERTKSTFSDAMGSVTLLLTLKMHHPARGKRALREDYEFNADLGSVLNDYAASVADMKLDDNDTSSQSQISQATTLTANTPAARSDRDAALELKAVVSSGSTFLLKAALQYIQVDARDQKGRTALSYAAEWAKYDIAKALLDEGANVSARGWSLSGWGNGHDPWFHCGATPLWWAANGTHTDIAELLLRHGANPNSRTTSGRSPLQESCFWGDIDTAKLLLSKKADINAQNANGWAPLHEAVNNQQMSCLQLLVSHGALLDLTLARPAGKTALHIAVEQQRIDMVQLLLENGANPQSPMVEDVTPLHLAAAEGWILGIETLANCRGVSLDPRDALLYEIPLHKAARNRHVEAMNRLFALGANRQVKNVDGKTCEEILECSQADPGQWDVSDQLAWLSA